MSERRIEAPVLLYDDSCGLCSRTVRLILRLERRHTLLFASLQGDHAGRLRRRHPELGDLDSVVWVDPPRGDGTERVLVKSVAALQIARYLGGMWRLASLARLVPAPLRDRLYGWIARHRHRLGSGAGACGLPPAAARGRFLDAPSCWRPPSPS